MATDKKYHGCDAKYIMVKDDNKILMPPAAAEANTMVVAGEKVPGACEVAFFLGIVGGISFLVALLIYCDQLDGLPKFQIQSALTNPIENTSSSSSRIWPIDFNFTFSITKGLKSKTVLYNFDSISLFYNGVFLSNTTLVPFFQGPEEQSTVEARFSVGPASVDEPVANAIVADRQQRGMVEVAVEVDATVTIGPDLTSNRQRKRSVWVTCKGVKVVFSPNYSSFGTLSEGPKDCTFELDDSPVY